MQACEVLQTCAVDETGARETCLAAAGLVEVCRQVLQRDGVAVAVSVLVPSGRSSGSVSGSVSDKQRKGRAKLFASGEIVLALVDVLPTGAGTGTRAGTGAGTVTPALLASLAAEPVSLSHVGVGLVQEDVQLQPTALALAMDCLALAAPYLVPAARAPARTPRPLPGAGAESQPRKNKNTNKETNNGTSNDRGKVGKGRAMKRGASEHEASAAAADAAAKATTIGGHPLPKKVRVLGYGMGGGAASIVAMSLDGSLGVTSLGKGGVRRGRGRKGGSGGGTGGGGGGYDKSKSKSRGRGVEGASAVQAGVDECLGLYAGAVRGLTLGAPPCVSRTLVLTVALTLASHSLSHRPDSLTSIRVLTPHSHSHSASATGAPIHDVPCVW